MLFRSVAQVASPDPASADDLLERTDALCDEIGKFFDKLAEEDHDRHEGVPTEVLKRILMRNSKCACEALRVHLKARK